MRLRLTLSGLLAVAGLSLADRANAQEACILIQVPKGYNKADLATRIEIWRQMERRQLTQVPIFVVYNGQPYLENVGIRRRCNPRAAIATVDLHDPRADSRGIRAEGDFIYGVPISAFDELIDPAYVLRFRLRDSDASCRALPDYLAFLNAIALYFAARADRREFKMAISQLSNYWSRGECVEFQAAKAYAHTRKLLENRRRLGAN